MNASTPQDLVEHALATSRADACIAIVRDTTSVNLRWANNSLTTNGVSHRRTVTVICIVETASGTATGSATGTAASGAQVTSLVTAAETAARQSPAAEDVAELVEGQVGPGWDEGAAETSIEVFADLTPGLGAAFARAEADRRVLSGFVEHDVTTTYLGSSTGLRLRHVQPTGHYGCTGKTANLDASAWVGGATRDFGEVDISRVDAELAQRLAWAELKVDLPPGRYDTILPPTAVADLILPAYWSASAREAHEGQSVFSRPGGGTRIGETVWPSAVQLFSDPSYDGLWSAPFVTASTGGNATSVFDNGLPLRRTDWVRDGRLASLLQTRHSARMTKQPVTPVVDNLVLRVDGSEGSTADLVSGMERGLLLTCLWYIRVVDPQTLLLTGLTRDGVYLVEDGQVSAAVNNFRFNESPIDLLARFSSASGTGSSFSREWGDYFSRTATPALRVPDFHMSSLSRAT